MKWLILWVTLVALMLFVTAAAAETLPVSVDKSAVEKAVAFATSIDGTRDVVTATITNPLTQTLKGEATLTLPGEKPLKKRFSVRAGKSDVVTFDPKVVWDGRSAITAEASVKFEGVDAPVTRTMNFDTSQRLFASASCPLSKSFEFRVINPSKSEISGKLRLFDVKGIKPKSIYEKFTVDSQTIVSFVLADPAPKEFSLGFQLEDGAGRIVLKTPVLNYTILDDFADVTNREKVTNYQVVADDDTDGPPSALIEGALRPAPYTTMPDMPSLRLKFNFNATAKPARVVPVKDLPLADNPIEVGAWISGDTVGSTAKCRFVDSTGRSFESAGYTLDWRGWRYKSMSLEASGDQKPKPPLRWDSIFMVDPAGKASSGLIYIGPMMLVSQVQPTAAEQPKEK